MTCRPGRLPRALDCVLARPLPSRGLVSWAVRLVHMGDLGDKRVVGVGVCQHGADREKNYVTYLSARALQTLVRRWVLPLEIVNAGLH